MAAVPPKATHLKGSLRDLSGWNSYWHPRPHKDEASVRPTLHAISHSVAQKHHLVPEEAWGQEMVSVPHPQSSEPLAPSSHQGSLDKSQSVQRTKKTTPICVPSALAGMLPRAHKPPLVGLSWQVLGVILYSNLPLRADLPLVILILS